jgi:hypothetical protein
MKDYKGEGCSPTLSQRWYWVDVCDQFHTQGYPLNSRVSGPHSWAFWRNEKLLLLPVIELGVFGHPPSNLVKCTRISAFYKYASTYCVSNWCIVILKTHTEQMILRLWRVGGGLRYTVQSFVSHQHWNFRNNLFCLIPLDNKMWKNLGIWGGGAEENSPYSKNTFTLQNKIVRILVGAKPINSCRSLFQTFRYILQNQQEQLYLHSHIWYTLRWINLLPTLHSDNYIQHEKYARNDMWAPTLMLDWLFVPTSTNWIQKY